MILAFDVSGSMAADDLAPTRMEAAKAAARTFVERQPTSIRIGVVAFSDSGFSIQVPTNDQTAGARRDRPPRARARHVARAGHPRVARRRSRPPTPIRRRATTPTARPTRRPSRRPCPPGRTRRPSIVLLTDGENNQSPDPLEAAGAAADRGVRIYTVGIGSAAGTTLEVEGFKVHSQLDESMLRQISERTDGTYYGADNPDELSADLRGHRHPPRHPGRGDGGHLAVRRCRGPGPRSSGASRRSCGSGGCHEPARRRCSSSCSCCCRCSSRCVSGSCGARRSGLRYSSLSLVRDALPGSSRIRRHLPFALFILALGSLVVAMARPVDIVSVPGRPDDRHPRDGRLAEHVLDRHRAQPTAGGRGGGRVVHREPGRDHPDRHRRLRRLRRDRPGADQRPGGAARRRREPDDRSTDGGRQRDPEVASTRSRRSTRASPRARTRTRLRTRPRRRSRPGPTPPRSSCC